MNPSSSIFASLLRNLPNSISIIFVRKLKCVTKCLSCSYESLGALPCLFVHAFGWVGGWAKQDLGSHPTKTSLLVTHSTELSWMRTLTVYTVAQLTDLLLSNPLQLVCQSPYPPDL